MTREVLDDLLELVKAVIKSERSSAIEDLVQMNDLYEDFIMKHIVESR